MTRLLCFFFALLISACSFKNLRLSGGTSPVESQRFLLGEPLDYGKIENFTAAVEAAFSVTMKDYGLGKNVKMSYRIEPRGLVNSFSETEVVCMAGNGLSRSDYVQICESFFATLENILKRNGK